MLQKGAFSAADANVDAGIKVVGMEFWKLSGSSSGARIAKFAEDKTQEYLCQEYERLGILIAKFDNPATPYEATPRADVAPTYSDYEHLERVKEWSTGKNGENDE